MIMVLLVILAIVLIVLLYVLFRPSGGEKVQVSFSEVVGNEIIEHDKLYSGLLDYNKDMFTIKGLKLKRPLPPRMALKQTRKGKRKINLIRFENNRYGYRIPTLNDSIMVYKRDTEGNIIKNKKGKPIIIKKKWSFAENVIEQDVVHWQESEDIKNEQRHKIKATLWDKWGAPISMALIFLLAIIFMGMMTKEWKVTKNAIFEQADETQQQAERTSNNLNNVLEKITGQRTFDQDQSTTFINQTGGGT